MAANQQPPGLLLTSYCIEGRLVYSVRLESVSASSAEEDSDDEPPALEIRLSPDPIARFLHDDTKFQAIAVSGCTILGLVHGSRDTGVLDIATRDSAPGPPLRDPKLRPVMLPVGADTVIVMDTILRGGGRCCFEALRRVPGGWRADPLPNPPIASLLEPEGDDEEDSIGLLPTVGAYFALGTRVWISINNRDLGITYSLDTQHGGTWREEGTWALPLRGRSLFVPELGGLVFGFTSTTCLKPRCHRLCALDVEARPPVVRRTWEFHAERKEEVPVGAGDAVSLAHLGNGRFCIARPVNVERAAMLSPWCNGKGTSFAVVDVTRTPPGPGELQLARRGRPHTHQWGWPYEHNGHVDFLI